MRLKKIDVSRKGITLLCPPSLKIENLKRWKALIKTKCLRLNASLTKQEIVYMQGCYMRETLQKIYLLPSISHATRELLLTKEWGS